ncbi:unnamed protein product [Moneuplotes crassus]|uniref:Uncharacterized protein n=1 Tax=Euplotes crassus TaxID=5936 RepID=A0AAD1XVF8_EUPCR|nr:unnamed protein product [Moneuplotes crassus]
MVLTQRVRINCRFFKTLNPIVIVCTTRIFECKYLPSKIMTMPTKKKVTEIWINFRCTQAGT